MAKTDRHITILGGGPAGLAVAYYAHEQQRPFELYEAASRVGGNCITLNHQDFLFDSGAHRFHDRDAEVTAIIQNLLGAELERIHVPSQIYRDGKFVDFPLSPFGLLKFLGPFRFIKAACQVLFGKDRVKSPKHFKALALSRYGRTISELFLLDYTEKLWGLPPEQLSVEVAGKRLSGLSLKSFLLETIRGKKAKVSHLDGEFFYPKNGIGSIFDALYDHCNPQQIYLNSRITKLHHSSGHITQIEVNGTKTFPVEEVVATLPLGLIFSLLDPPPPPHLLKLAHDLKFRNLILLGFFLDKPSVNLNGSMYFPSGDYPFTRIYEPRNRSATMSPPGKTSLMVEIPCQPESPVWNQDPDRLCAEIKRHLLNIGFFEPQELIDTCSYRIYKAYPILETEFMQKTKPLFTYLDKFDNLTLSGRNGLFSYSHIHDHFRNAKRIMDSKST